jgi:DNA segregation ATPase FtsK/SpoIIIE, S-DNA-T family
MRKYILDPFRIISDSLKYITGSAPDIDINTRLSIFIISSAALSILIFLSLLSLAGSFGATVGIFLRLSLGWGAFIICAVLMYSSFILYNIQKDANTRRPLHPGFIWGIGIIFWSLLGFFNVIANISDQANMEKGGGFLGFILYPWILNDFGRVGASLILFVLMFIGFFLLTQLTFVQFVSKLKAAINDPKALLDLVPDILEIWKKRNHSVDSVEQVIEQIHDLEEEKYPLEDLPVIESYDQILETGSTDTHKKIDMLGVVKDPQIGKKGWMLPSKNILHVAKTRVETGNIEQNKHVIQQTLSNFNIKVEMEDVVTGPTVAQYRFKPASGVKLSAIENLIKDLSLALAVNNLRIDAPVGGKSLVGLEVPNKIRSSVYLRDLLDSPSFAHFEDDLAVAIGKDVAGRNIIYSLAKMPHLLVAGATGAGKSVYINSLLLSLLYRYSPLDLQLLMVDMKRVELKLYEGIPHLLANVITAADGAINALKWTLLEMERRYKLLEQHGKRNIIDYNNFTKSVNEVIEQKNKEKENGDEEATLEKLPYIVFVVDELGDLMMQSKSEVEPIIVRLTQMSRAVGIHLVLGTQRPDIHVVTGLIKANVPSRIAFAVASQIDSRVIMDKGGAQDLLGMGDGFFLNPQSMHPERFQGAYVSEDEVRDCVKFLRNQAELKPEFSNLTSGVTAIQKQRIMVPGMANSPSDDADDYYDQAKKLVIQYQRASTSFLQQMMGVGYPKAAKIMQQLEDSGVVGPANGSKMREIYITPDGDEE